ncbi:MAG: SDR family oxidoreductase [Clostridia bacterium]|nr:SDR family oxidoreductase [Clostridia bacterium]
MSKKWIFEKNVIITGASSGIGKELVKTFLTKYNCRVLGVSRDQTKAKAFSEELASDSYSYYCFDVGVEDNWRNFADYLTKIAFFPDLIINNAGVLPKFRSVDNTPIEVFAETMQIDFWSAVYCVKYLDEALSHSKTPSIVNVSSSSALANLVGTAPYTSAKTALRAFTECYATEQKGKKYVAVVCPGFTKTEIFRNQSQRIDSGVIGKVSTPVHKMTRKIVKGIVKRKMRMIFGKDAKIMNLFYKFMPKKSATLFSFVMRKSSLSIFNEIFEIKE